MALIDRLLAAGFLGNSVLKYLISFLIFVAISCAILVVNKAFKSIIDRIKDKKNNVGIRLAQFLFRRVSPLLYVFAFLIALEQLNLQDFRSVVHSIDRGFVAILIIYLLIAVVDFLYSEILLTSKFQDDQKRAMRILMLSIKVLIVLFGLIFIIKNFIPTFEITSLLTTFGVGGVIVGLGLQRILQDVLNYFAIIFDKPFVEGNYIVMGDTQGTISSIGMRSTRLVSLSGEEVNIPNSVITSQVVRNWSRLATRRVQINVSIALETEKEKLEKMSDLLKGTVERVEKTVFAFARLSNFGSYSINYTLAYYINEIDYNNFMRLQEAVNIAILESLRKEAISIVYPIQVVRLQDSGKEEDR